MSGCFFLKPGVVVVVVAVMIQAVGSRVICESISNNPYLVCLTGTTAIGRSHHAEIYERAGRGNEDVVLRQFFTLYYCTISNI